MPTIEHAILHDRILPIWSSLGQIRVNQTALFPQQLASRIDFSQFLYQHVCSCPPWINNQPHNIPFQILLVRTSYQLVSLTQTFAMAMIVLKNVLVPIKLDPAPPLRNVASCQNSYPSCSCSSPWSILHSGTPPHLCNLLRTRYGNDCACGV
jgi:hypothetical protein